MRRTPVHALRGPRRGEICARQRGVVLVISLIVLVALTMAGIALVRSTDTGTTIAGNMASRTAALHAVDTGIESAFTGITGAAGFFTNPTVATTTAAAQYFPILQADTAPADGIPDLDWTAVPGTNVDGNLVRVAIERMCAINVDPSNIVGVTQQCTQVPTITAESNKAGSIGPSVANRLTGYRVSIRVEGPRNTVVTAQSIIAR
jgi:Tfp pilus assembly protein PilX